MSGRTVLITGGASGSGAATAREFHRLGADVVIGTRRLDRYAGMVRELGTQRVHPFIADLTVADELGRAVDRMMRQGPFPTDLVHCAAGGLEPIMKRFIHRLIAIRRLPEPDLPAAVDRLRSDLRDWSIEDADLAFAINYQAPCALTEYLLPVLPVGANVVFYSSVWSSFYGRSQVPAFYHSIAQSKLAFETWLFQAAPDFARRRIATSIISGHIVRDTIMGELIEKYVVPLLPRQDQERARLFFIDSVDMVRAAVAALSRRTPNAAPACANRLYVYGPGQVVDDLAADSAPLAEGTPLPDGAPGVGNLLGAVIGPW